jgi:hypothetical protein
MKRNVTVLKTCEAILDEKDVSATIPDFAFVFCIEVMSVMVAMVAESVECKKNEEQQSHRNCHSSVLQLWSITPYSGRLSKI